MGIMFQQPELKIEDELRDLLYTTTDCTPLSMPYMLRQFRRNYYEERLNCPACNPSASGNIEGDPSCPYCRGQGWLWDDRIITGWLYGFEPRRSSNNLTSPSSVGEVLEKHYKIVTMPEVFIFPGDVVYDLKIDSNKRINIPVVIQDRYLCIYSDRMSSNQSNSEFNIAGLRK